MALLYQALRLISAIATAILKQKLFRWYCEVELDFYFVLKIDKIWAIIHYPPGWGRGTLFSENKNYLNNSSSDLW